MDIWVNDFDELRDIRRRELGRITFDCFNCKLKGMTAHCAKGYKLGLTEDGMLDLLDVLKGVLSPTCKDCEDYDGGEE